MLLCVVAYALSPIDLIPDFIPVLGYLDDLLLLPLGIWLAIRLMLPAILSECRRGTSLGKLATPNQPRRRRNRSADLVINRGRPGLLAEQDLIGVAEHRQAPVKNLSSARIVAPWQAA